MRAGKAPGAADGGERALARPEAIFIHVDAGAGYLWVENVAYGTWLRPDPNDTDITLVDT